MEQPQKAREPKIVEAKEGEWLEVPPPDQQPQFACIVQPRGTVIVPERWEVPRKRPDTAEGTGKGGEEMAEDPLNAIEKLDPDLVKVVRQTSKVALADGALPRKTKLLIAMALDAAHGAVGGVRALANMAMEAGATKQEVAEALRVAHYVSGAGSVYTAAHALEGMF